MATTQSALPVVTNHRVPPEPTKSAARLRDPAYQAFLLLRSVFTIAPILFGLDKYFHVLVNWDRYVAPDVVVDLPWSDHELRYVVVVIEVVAVIVVADLLRFGGYFVAAWLAEIIVDLLLIPGFYDVALRDFG